MSRGAAARKAAPTIRAFRPDDAPALAALFHVSVRQVGLRDYSAEQVRAWSPAPLPPERYLRLARERRILVAVDAADEPVGYIELEANGHLDHLYCRPDVVGTGVGAALAEAAERHAVEQGLAEVFVEASEAARRLFLRRGLVEVARNDIERQGVAIHNFTMRERLIDGRQPRAAR